MSHHLPSRSVIKLIITLSYSERCDCVNVDPVLPGNTTDSIWLKTGEEELRNVDKNKLEKAEVIIVISVKSLLVTIFSCRNY